MRPCRPDVPLKLLRWKGLAGGGESGRMGPISERDHRTPDFDARRLMWMPSFGQRSQAVKRISIIMLIIGSVPPALRGCPEGWVEGAIIGTFCRGDLTAPVFMTMIRDLETTVGHKIARAGRGECSIDQISVIVLFSDILLDNACGPDHAGYGVAHGSSAACVRLELVRRQRLRGGVAAAPPLPTVDLGSFNGTSRRQGRIHHRRGAWPGAESRHSARRRRCRHHCRRSEEHTSELQSRQYLVCRLLLEKKKNKILEHHLDQQKQIRDRL